MPVRVGQVNVLIPNIDPASEPHFPVDDQDLRVVTVVVTQVQTQTERVDGLDVDAFGTQVDSNLSGKQNTDPRSS